MRTVTRSALAAHQRRLDAVINADPKLKAMADYAKALREGAADADVQTARQAAIDAGHPEADVDMTRQTVEYARRAGVLR